MAIDKNLMSGSTTLLVLSLLETKDQYGYEMIKELERRSEKVFTLKEGTLYPILHKLENDGMITSYEKESTAGKRRKYYSLTKEGKKLLAAKKQEWLAFSQKVNQVIGGEVNAFS
ncbi:MAG TPA: PadR family transcriptional regulator [Peptococcaceae bacterium]|nr:PadR family transcriptional regulator [Peptococcaceae bacterium]